MGAQFDGDLSDRFHQVVGNLTGAGGVSYREFRSTLKPRYAVVWRDVALGYLALAAVSAAVIAAPFPNRMVALAGAFVASAALGYFHQYLALYMHEAAHLNIARSRPTNDMLANALFGVMQGFSIRTYRAKHFDHHRHLGMPNDTEHHYFQPLDWRFFASTLSGVRAMAEIFRLRGAVAPLANDGDLAPSDSPPLTASSPETAAAEAVAHDDASRRGQARTSRGLDWVVFAGSCLHLLVVVGAAALGKWPFSVAWILSFLLWFPFFSMLRQILEHRDFRAQAGVDYSRTPHGALTRTFGDGPLASTLGAAGFNRHLIHHWEPQISYTRLRELERFLLMTAVGPIIERRRSTYASAFIALWASRNTGPGASSKSSPPDQAPSST